MYGQFRVTLTMSVEAETTDGNLAYVQGITRGALTPLDGGDAKLVEDRFVAILTRSGSNWRVTRLLWGPANESTSPSQ